MNKDILNKIINITLIVLLIVNCFLNITFITFICLVLAVALVVFLFLPKEEDEIEKIEVLKVEKKEEVKEEKKEEVEPKEVPLINFPKNIDEKEFAKEMFLLYRKIQTDFMNFNYEDLQEELGLNIWRQFEHQLKHLEETGNQSVRTNIDLQKIQTMSFVQEKDCYVAEVNLSVLEDKYMKKLEEDFRLTSNKVRYESCYNLTFINNHRKKIARKCTNCGEKLQGNPTNCPICDERLLEATDKWILTDIKLLGSHTYKK